MMRHRRSREVEGLHTATPPPTTATAAATPTGTHPLQDFDGTAQGLHQIKQEPSTLYLVDGRGNNLAIPRAPAVEFEWYTLPTSQRHVPDRHFVDVGPLCAAFVDTANLSSNSGEVLRVKQELPSFDDDLSLDTFAFEPLSRCRGLPALTLPLPLANAFEPLSRCGGLLSLTLPLPRC